MRKKQKQLPDWVHSTTITVDQNTSDIGSQLRDTREAQGLSCDEVATALKIRRCYVEALENNDFSQLPGAVYTEGYLKNYAEYLELNADSLLEDYRLISGDEEKEVTFMLPEPYRDELRPSRLVLVSAFVAIIAVYAVWYHYSAFEPLQARQMDDVHTPGELDSGIILLATGQTKIELLANDGDVLKEKELRTGDTYFVPVGNADQVRINDAWAVDIFINGEQISLLDEHKKEGGQAVLKLDELDFSSFN